MTTAIPASAQSLGFVELRQRGDARAIALPHTPRAVKSARRVLVDDVRNQVGEEITDEAEVITGELLANAVRHAAPLDGDRVVLRWQVRGGVLDLEVTDGGSRAGVHTPVRPLRPGLLAVHGRGLRIVRALANEWGVFEDSDGRRTVWACLGGPSRRRHRW